MEKKTVLNEETLVPIGLLITLLLFSAWLTNVWATGIKVDEKVQKLEQRQEKENDKINYQLEKLNNKMDEVLKEVRNGGK